MASNNLISRHFVQCLFNSAKLFGILELVEIGIGVLLDIIFMDVVEHQIIQEHKEKHNDAQGYGDLENYSLFFQEGFSLCKRLFEWRGEY